MGIADAGRWSLVRKPAQDSKADPGDIEHAARVLLRRYGVVCWRLLEREAQWLPPWRELLREYQRLEARGEIRGGRFIAGVVGQQFALPEAVAALRSVRKRAHDGAMIAVSTSDPLNLLGSVIAGDKVPRQPGARLLLRDGIPIATLVAVSASDPLNLVGGILAGDKVPRQAGARLLLRDGIPIATLVAGEFKPLVELAPSDEHAARIALLRDPGMHPGSNPAPGSRPMADPLGLHR
jgi:ATP-dependent Lhr-like helicase